MIDERVWQHSVHEKIKKIKWDNYIPSVSNTYTYGATLPVSKLEQGGALCHWSARIK